MVLKDITLFSSQIQLAVNKQSKNGWSPLIVAASRGHVEAVKVSRRRDVAYLVHFLKNIFFFVQTFQPT
jgi:hypothetical protein